MDELQNRKDTKKIHILDARRLLCPLPVIRVQEAVETLQPGDQIKAICTDPGAMHDIPAWVRVHGHKVLETTEDSENYEYIVIVEVGKT